jgi:hypothetical protein
MESKLPEKSGLLQSVHVKPKIGKSRAVTSSKRRHCVQNDDDRLFIGVSVDGHTLISGVRKARAAITE